ncbi:Rab effector MyRIP [Taenia crassiceps]|uniref:Rab effector MyRIP n=1 Tax=Taenia crassiceps TaxID=6207 RepID=A0ABR4Q0J7_9CEST
MLVLPTSPTLWLTSARKLIGSEVTLEEEPPEAHLLMPSTEALKAKQQPMPPARGSIKNSRSKQNGSLVSPVDANANSNLDVNLGRFSEEEREAILMVVKRDLELRCMEKHRLKKIRSGLLQEDSQAPLSLPGSANTCTICRSQFIMLINPRLTCNLCRREICRRCAKSYNGDLLCRICSRDIFYRAMVCHWFYDNSPDKLCGRASDTIVKSLFKEKLPALSDLTEEQLHKTICNYLKPERETYVNGIVITLDVMLRIQNEQIRAFTKRYQEIRNAAVNSLTRVRANALKNGQENVDKEIESTTSQFLQQTREALRKLLQMLCITEEKYKMSLPASRQQNTSTRVLEITQKQVEQLVGHKIKVPDEYVNAEVDEDLESFVASVTGGPEEFFANVLLEDLTTAMRNSQSYGQRPRPALSQ